MSAPPNKKLKKLLDRLQVESWQLELLVSGFAIFLTASSFKPIDDFGNRMAVIAEGIGSQFGVLQMFAVILFGSIFFIFINLILHVIFRGMWISAIGLRSISGEIDFEELKFVQPFDRFMKKKLGSFDQFIQRLEDISSVIFAFTFLIVFMIISLFLFILFVGIIGQFLKPIMNDNPDAFFRFGFIAFILTTLFCGLLYFVDFITLGFFKKKRWIAVWYYPIYRFFSIITFSWLYRPLYYNLIDNKFGRRIGLFLVPYFITIISIASISATVNLYIPEYKGGLELKDRLFADTRKEDETIRTISIPSKFINNGYLELFIKYNARHDDKVIKENCPKVVPDEVSGIGSEMVIIGSDDKYSSPADSLLDCVSQIYNVYINDSLYQELNYYFYKHQEFGEEGIKTIVDLEQSPRGKYILRVDRMNYSSSKDSIYFTVYASTPFWLE